MKVVGILSEEKSAFPENLSASDMVLIIRCPRELTREVPACNIDLAEAYDSVDSSSRFGMLQRTPSPEFTMACGYAYG